MHVSICVMCMSTSACPFLGRSPSAASSLSTSSYTPSLSLSFCVISFCFHVGSFIKHSKAIRMRIRMMPCGWEKNITLYDCRWLQYVKGWMDGWVGGWMDGWVQKMKQVNINNIIEYDQIWPNEASGMSSIMWINMMQQIHDCLRIHGLHM